jgi:hypothetical protein
VNLHDLHIATARAFIPAKIRTPAEFEDLHFDEFENFRVAEIRLCTWLSGVDHVMRDAEGFRKFVGDDLLAFAGFKLRCDFVCQLVVGSPVAGRC